MNEPGDQPTRRPCLNPAMPIKTNDRIKKSAAFEYGDGFLSIQRPNLPNEKDEKKLQQLRDIVPVGVTLMDPPEEQVAS
jgi:hypothetical protein